MAPSLQAEAVGVAPLASPAGEAGGVAAASHPYPVVGAEEGVEAVAAARHGLVGVGEAVLVVG